METEKKKKNHWTQAKVDTATKNINQEIYKRNRQAPLQITCGAQTLTTAI